MEKKAFGEPVQTATVVGAAYGIHRTTLTQAAKAGVLGGSAYRSGDAWLIKTDHPDFWEWLREHEYHPRVKGYRKQQAARAAQQRLLEAAGIDETPRVAAEARADAPAGRVLEEPGSFRAHTGVPWEPDPGEDAPVARLAVGEWAAAPIPERRAPASDAPSPGGGAYEDGLQGVEKAVGLDAGDHDTSGATGVQEGPVVAVLPEEGEMSAETASASGFADTSVSSRHRHGGVQPAV